MAKKVFIDPGHGGNDSGAVGINNLLEKDITLSVAKKVYDFLKKQGLEIKLSRTDDKTLSLKDRTSAANSWKADCFISIHCNAFNGNASGVETYSYTTSTNDLAANIHEEVLKTKCYTKNRGTKTANFYVIKYTNMRACLIELAFIDNIEDSKILLKKQDELAGAIAKGICKYLGVEYKFIEDNDNTEDIPVIDENTFYRVVCGSFNNRVYAEERLEQLKELGIEDSFIVIYNKE